MMAPLLHGGSVFKSPSEAEATAMQLLTVLSSVSMVGVALGVVLMGVFGTSGRQETAPQEPEPNPESSVRRTPPLDIGKWRSSEDSLSQATAMFLSSPLTQDHAKSGSNKEQ